MKNIIISPKSTSKSALFLAESLNMDYINPYAAEKYDFSDYDKVINWGVSAPIKGNVVLNKPQQVKNAINKVETFYQLSGHVRVAEWTENEAEARNWAMLGYNVVARKLAKSTCSKGIDMLVQGDPFLPDYKFFTKYLDHDAEYRINAFKGKVVSIQEKITRGNGIFKFKLLYGEPTQPIKDMVEKVYERMGLDIFGLDILADYEGNFNLLEVNSAPSIFGKTAERFVKLIGKELA